MFDKKKYIQRSINSNTDDYVERIMNEVRKKREKERSDALKLRRSIEKSINYEREKADAEKNHLVNRFNDKEYLLNYFINTILNLDIPFKDQYYFINEKKFLRLAIELLNGNEELSDKQFLNCKKIIFTYNGQEHQNIDF